MQSFEVIHASQIHAALAAVPRLFYGLAVAVTIYAYLNFVLQPFPLTRPLGERLYWLVVGPLQTFGLAFLGELPHLFFLVVLAIIVRYVLKILRLYFEAMLLLAAGRTPGLKREPPPFVLQKALGDFSVTYEINVYTHDAIALLRQYSALHANILDVFNEYGIQIMTPAYEGDPAEPKVVRQDDWYPTPARGPAPANDGPPQEAGGTTPGQDAAS